jgi:tetratricopeptide (TPR) repeat protein
MQATASVSTPPLDVFSLLQACREDLGELVRSPAAVESLADRGISLGDARGLTQSHYEALYQVARNLCKAFEFEQALPIALELVANEGSDPRFYFLAGTCLLHLRDRKNAVVMFEKCLESDPGHAVAMYRIGECMAAFGEDEDARRAFESVVDMGRGQEKFGKLQRLAQVRLDGLRQAAR